MTSYSVFRRLKIVKFSQFFASTMVRPPPIVTSKPPQNENRGYGPGNHSDAYCCVTLPSIVAVVISLFRYNQYLRLPVKPVVFQSSLNIITE